MKRQSWNIHERFLRHIWSKQYLRTPLLTADGKSLKVIDIGSLNHDSGPDFLNAKVIIDKITYAGDVEIHRTIFDWYQHEHQEDPHYNKTVLHVVLESGNNFPPTIVKSGRKIPVLILGNFLSESIHAIWQKAVLDERAEKSFALRCSGKNDSFSIETIDRWLGKLASERLELKLRRFEERLKQLAYEKRMVVHEWHRPYGEPPLEGEYDEIPIPLPELSQKDFAIKELWDQLLYEGIMDGLGYSKNRDPFIRLAQAVNLNTIKKLGEEIKPFKIQALLFGAAGLIPKMKTMKRKQSREYVRQLAKDWKSFRPYFHSELLHLADWQFFPTRPANFPTIRIAAASEIIIKLLFGDLFREIIQTIKSELSETDKESKLIKLFVVETNDFWKNHYNFEETALTRVNALGTARIREIIINSVLPISLLYARVFKETGVRESTLNLYHALPASENNSITRMVGHQLLKGQYLQQRVLYQQAMIQLYKYYCSEDRCCECEFGKLKAV